MFTVQGQIRRSIINVQSQFERLGYISSNIANMNTNGYKSVRFDQMLDEDGYLEGYVRRDYSGVGSIIRTQGHLDVALNTPGFIPVTSPTGDVTYTRDGSFKLDKDGYLITNDGYLVGDGIQLPANYNSVRIEPDGQVIIVKEDASEPEVIGKIPFVQFANPEGLKVGDCNKLIATEESGEPILDKKDTPFVQGMLEISNVSAHNEVTDVLRITASMKASFSMMKVIDDMYSKAINLKQ